MKQKLLLWIREQHFLTFSLIKNLRHYSCLLITIWFIYDIFDIVLATQFNFQISFIWIDALDKQQVKTMTCNFLFRRKMRKQVFNNLLLVLACFDLAFILTALPVHTSPVFKLESWLYSILYPYLFYPFTSIFFTGGIYMIISITVER